MAFENVNVTSLKSSLNGCLNSLNKTSMEELIEVLNRNDKWCGESKDKLKEALEILVNTRYKELEDYLNQCLTNADKIQSYQDASLEKSSYNSQISGLNKQLDALQSKYNYSSNETEKAELKTKINNTKNQISDLENKLNTSESNMNSISSDIII